MRAQEIRQLSDDEIREKVQAFKEEMFNLRAQAASGQLDRSSHIAEVRHDIARALTILRERKGEN
ncbi:MAG: 50S ribosomal protein L29 [Candidatus Omnitrophica bacterium]|nr:50S ribosomal protein L29 [Candidatus Omnitrophota bacterium]